MLQMSLPSLAIIQLHLVINQHSADSSLRFPSSYPTSCLLGSVDVEDVMSQEDYRAALPQGESSSPYVFVCSNPRELLVKYPMTGKHKICEDRGIFCLFDKKKLFLWTTYFFQTSLTPTSTRPL